MTRMKVYYIDRWTSDIYFKEEDGEIRCFYSTTALIEKSLRIPDDSLKLYAKNFEDLFNKLTKLTEKIFRSWIREKLITDVNKSAVIIRRTYPFTNTVDIIDKYGFLGKNDKSDETVIFNTFKDYAHIFNLDSSEFFRKLLEDELKIKYECLRSWVFLDLLVFINLDLIKKYCNIIVGKYNDKKRSVEAEISGNPMLDELHDRYIKWWEIPLETLRVLNYGAWLSIFKEKYSDACYILEEYNKLSDGDKLKIELERDNNEY